MSLPARLGRLTQVERLGVGGFASVWLYHDDDLQSDVAVKALADNWAQRLDIRDRFLEEARILRRADSDYVVRVYDLGPAVSPIEGSRHRTGHASRSDCSTRCRARCSSPCR